MQPLSSIGLFKQHMTHALGALRTRREVLLTTMEVFVHEPLLDWIKPAAERQKLAPELG